ncbi:MAG: hypothetical protein RIB63_03805 [Fulvivirga sp.]
MNHQIRTLEIEEVRPHVPVPADLTLNVWEPYESFDYMDINLPLGVVIGLKRGPFIAFNYYLRLVNMTEVEESPYLTWGGHRRNTFELSVGWKFNFEKKNE